MSLPPTSIAQHYHERTKYTPEGIAARHRGSLDWSQQPVPYKTYKLGTEVDLKPYLDGDAPAVEGQTSNQSHTVGWQRLSRLLINSYGLTAKVPTQTGEPVYLRAAPSAGGLYPAEVYVVSRGMSLLPAGLYNYQARTHSLWRYWDDHVWQSLQEACLWHPALEQTHLAIVITSVFFRSAWRYEDRAYRRIFLDAGHLIGNLELASALTDYRPHLIGGFLDDDLNRLLYVNEEEEGAIAVLALADLLEVDQHLPRSWTALKGSVHGNFPALKEGQLLPYLHMVTKLSPRDPDPAKSHPIPPPPDRQTAKYNFPFCLKVSTKSSPIRWGDNLQDLERTILRRRSTRRYSGAELTLGELKALLDFTYHPAHYRDQGLDPTPDYCDLTLVETFLAVSGVEGLEEGCYYYAPEPQELRQIRFKNFRSELQYLCLGQELGRDAAVVLFHTADLKNAIQQYGDRVYRYLHLDAGHLGQRLNLAAIQLNLGVSGIGGFFDDQVNEVLGIPEDEAVLYITTLGRPVRRYQL